MQTLDSEAEYMHEKVSSINKILYGKTCSIWIDLFNKLEQRFFYNKKSALNAYTRVGCMKKSLL